MIQKAESRIHRIRKDDTRLATNSYVSDDKLATSHGKQRHFDLEKQLIAAKNLKLKAVARLLRKRGCKIPRSLQPSVVNFEGQEDMPASQTSSLDRHEPNATETMPDTYEERIDDEHSREFDHDDASIIFVTSSLTTDSFENNASHGFETAGGFGRKERSIHGIPVDRGSCDSMYSLSMLFNHLTCHPEDNITLEDWAYCG